MNEMLNGSILQDKNGKLMKIVDQEARDQAAHNAERIDELSEEIANMGGGSGGATPLVVTTEKHEAYSETYRVFTPSASYDEVMGAFGNGRTICLLATHPIDIGEGSYVDESWIYTFAGISNGHIMFVCPSRDGGVWDVLMMTNAGFVMDVEP